MRPRSADSRKGEKLKNGEKLVIGVQSGAFAALIGAPLWIYLVLKDRLDPYINYAAAGRLKASQIGRFIEIVSGHIVEGVAASTLMEKAQLLALVAILFFGFYKGLYWFNCATESGENKKEG